MVGLLGTSGVAESVVQQVVSKGGVDANSTVASTAALQTVIPACEGGCIHHIGRGKTVTPAHNILAGFNTETAAIEIPNVAASQVNSDCG